ncbi:MAG: hypothetical protein OEX04_07075 [Acidimicrobiia bacterium]|nr:hypothetical protein [Acidimicrobiia bacterium]MDH4307226.1 hypothetical protein [Acidimicrobiia bacterium]
MWRRVGGRAAVGVILLGNALVWALDRIDDRLAVIVAAASGAALVVAFKSSSVARAIGFVVVGLALLSALDLGLLPVIRL